MKIKNKYGVLLVLFGIILIIDGSFSMILVKDKRLLFQIGRFVRAIIGLIIAFIGTELNS